MIKKLQNNNNKTANKIQSVFQKSYTVEAKLLNAVDFPPLKRKLESYLNSQNQFFGYIRNQELAGVIEIDQDKHTTHIQSLVVNPIYFRQGIAQKLMEYVLNTFDSNLFTVETGVKNRPAIDLYKKLDFIEFERFNTDHGIRKIRFERKINDYKQ